MNDVGCGELADIVDGQLQLGVLPPLSGRLELVGDIVTDCEQAKPGCLYWGVHDGAEGQMRTQEAFFRGAAGVVVPEAAATFPWDGRFQIVVDCAREALCRLGRWRRSAFQGKLVIVGPGVPASEVMRGLGGDSEPFVVAGIVDAAQALVSVEEKDWAVLSLSAEAFWKIDEISALCCPHAVCIYTLPRGEQAVEPATVAGLLTGFPDDGCFVMVDDHQHKVMVGDRELLATEVRQDVFHFANEQLAVSRPQLPLALACWGVAEATNRRLPVDRWQLNNQSF